MKKIYIIAMAFFAIAASAGAQNMYDAMTFSENNYYGTARTMALGNAVTAVGGDLGTIGINPAGSAIANYGQFTVTPGFTFSSVSSSYSVKGDTSYGYGSGPVATRSKMNLPNLGFSMVFGTGRNDGLKSITFAVVSNQTDSYNNYASAHGSNPYTSKIAEFANAAYNIDESVLKEYNSFNNSSVSWDILTAYQGGMFGSYGKGNSYVGVTEALNQAGTYHYLPGSLSQTSITSKYGSKNDIVINMGMNVSDKLFFGFNIGIPTARYNYSESFFESADNPENFLITFQGNDGKNYDTYFNSGSYSYKYIADINGIYAKFGVIALPYEGLRVGASIQSPTAYTISESWQYSASTTYADSYYNDNQTSPAGDYSYCLRSPYLASLGVAYTFEGYGFISADYELADYSVMKFSDVHSDEMSSDPYLKINEANRNFAGLAHSLRLGAEVKVNPEFSVRAGYSLVTSPERHWTNNSGDDVDASSFISSFNDYYSGNKSLVTYSYYGDRTTSYSFGFGYSSPGSFFADIAARVINYPHSTFSPYYDYVNYDSTGNEVNVKSPKVLNSRSLWNVALTLGWRF